MGCIDVLIFVVVSGADWGGVKADRCEHSAHVGEQHVCLLHGRHHPCTSTTSIRTPGRKNSVWLFYSLFTKRKYHVQSVLLE